MFEKVAKTSLPKQVEQALKEAIFSGRIKPGEKLNEEKLAGEMHVSRVPIREALRLLGQQGIVTISENRGAHVTRLTASDVRELFEIRELLEPFAAALAAQSLTSRDINRLAALLRRMETAAREDDRLKFFRADLEFHRIIWRLSGHRLLEKILSETCEVYFACIHDIYHDLPLDLKARYVRHQAFFDVFKSGNAGRAETSFRSMLGGYGRRLVADLHKVQSEGKDKAE